MTSPASSLTADQAMAGSLPRFRVLKSGHVLTMHGNLDDTANLDLLSDLEQGVDVIDLRKIAAASWQGSRNLHSYLEHHPRPVQLVGIPSQLFSYLRFLPFTNGMITIAEAEVEAFNPRTLEKPCTRLLLQIKELETLAIAQGPIINLEIDKQILGIAEHLCPHYFQTPESRPPLFTNGWCSGAAEEANFWFNLCHLTNMIRTIAVARMDTARLALGLCIESLIIRLQCGERASQILNLPHTRLQNETLVEGIKRVDTALLKLLTGHQALDEKLQWILRLIQVSCWNSEVENPAAIYAAVEDLAGSTSAALVELESSEFEAEAIRMDIVGKGILNRAHVALQMAELTPDKRTREKLGELRDAFHVMNLLSEDDWDASADEILQTECEAENDLVKIRAQVNVIKSANEQLGYLRSDVQLIAGFLPDIRRNAKPWQGLRDSLYLLWQMREVSNTPEGKVYHFYFPGFATSTREASESGEITIDPF